jgi:hypothetical protein
MFSVYLQANLTNMLLKMFRVGWFLSFLVLFATLLYNYAGWQEQLIVQEESNEPVSMSREALFYILVAVFAIVNVLVYLVGKVYAEQHGLRAWFHGLVITINIFFIVAMNLVGLYNSAEKFDYSRIGFIIYGSIGLVVCWAVAWPIYLLFNKFFLKQAV